MSEGVERGGGLEGVEGISSLEDTELNQIFVLQFDQNFNSFYKILFISQFVFLM